MKYLHLISVLFCYFLFFLVLNFTQLSQEGHKDMTGKFWVGSVKLFYVSDQMSGKPSRKLTFVLLFGPILLLTLSDLLMLVQVVPASYQTDLVITIPLSSFSTKFHILKSVSVPIHTLLYLWSLVNQISIFRQSW